MGGKNMNPGNNLSSQNLSMDDEIEMANQADGSKEKESNTIMQQINNFSLTPMNDVLAE